MRILYLLLTILCLGPTTRAQNKTGQTSDADLKRWKKGFVVKQSGDTVKGKIKINDFLDVYYDCQHTASFKDRKGVATHYIPLDLRSFSYYDDRDSFPEWVMYESVSHPESEGRVFLRSYCDGACKVYGWTISEINGVGAGTGRVMHSSLIHTEKKYIQIRGSEFFPLRMMGFKKVMKEIFAMCPLIISRLDNKTYTYSNWRILVRDYNSGICK